jgi:hypothetical protein
MLKKMRIKKWVEIKILKKMNKGKKKSKNIKAKKKTQIETFA